mmetsp:Transcript_15202/g.54737  ORF Transcript_15202/g.54737 Transcript_15202/m.54737 type:complete len:467 (-) Transcript_15202:2575-3975(-)
MVSPTTQPPISPPQDRTLNDHGGVSTKSRNLDVVEASAHVVASAVGQGGWDAICERVALTRTVRVFLSSVFDGMEGERESLLEQHGPALEALCLQNNVELQFVDMLWGITNQDGADNLTVWKCLQSCDNSDIFIGYWAQRYGWCGKSLQPSLDEAEKLGYTWLANYRDRSVTEIEYQRAFLADGAGRASTEAGSCPGISMFFHRSPEYDRAQLKAAPPAERRKWRTEEGCEAALERQHKLVTKRAGKAFYDGYSDPAEGAEIQAECLSQLLHHLFSSEAMRGVETSSKRAQDSFRSARDRLYIPNMEIRTAAAAYFEKARDKCTTPLVITGAPGSGKSSAVVDLVNSLEADYGAVDESRAAPHDASFYKNTSARLPAKLRAAAEKTKLEGKTGPDTRPIYTTYFIGCTRLSVDFDEMTRQVAYQLLTAKVISEGGPLDYTDARWCDPLYKQLCKVPAVERISFMLD